MKWLKNRLLAVTSLALTVFLLLSMIRLPGGLEAMELFAYDKLLAMRADSKVRSPIVIITETEADLKRLGFPVADAYYAKALEKLTSAGVSVIGMDKYRDQPVAPGSKELEQVVTDHDNIFWTFFVGAPEQGSVAPPAFLKDSAQIGFNNALPDADGVFRRGLLFMDNKQGSYTSLPLLMAQKYLGGQNIKPEADEQGYLRLGKSVFYPLMSHSGPYADETLGGYQILLNYPNLKKSFLSFSLSDLLDGKVQKEKLQGKIVLLGSTAPSLNDYKFFPGLELPRFGVELHAHLIDQILQAASGDFPLLSDLSRAQEYLWIFLWCQIGGLLSLKRLNLLQMSGIMLLGLISLTALALYSFHKGLWIPLLPPALGLLLSSVASEVWFSNQERMERRQLLKIFETHVSPQVANTLWENREKFFLEGGVTPSSLTATVLFTDLVNFTSVAEGMDPLTLMHWLNEYMEVMSTIIMEEGGMINKYIGDAIMAVFGAPVMSLDAEGVKKDALSAVASAMRMNGKLRELNETWRQQGLPEIFMRVGIHTGVLVAGSFGGRQRMEYTVIGDTVNTASRLESFDKTIAEPTREFPCRILIGERTFELVNSDTISEKVGECHLKGKINTLNIYRVIKAK